MCPEGATHRRGARGTGTERAEGVNGAAQGAVVGGGGGGGGGGGQVVVGVEKDLWGWGDVWRRDGKEE